MAVLRPLLQPDEPIEVMVVAGVGAVSVRRTMVTAVVTGILSGGTMMLAVRPQTMFIALTDRRLFFVDGNKLTARPRRLVMEIPRNAVRTQGLRKGPLGLTLRTTLVDGSERGLTMVFAHPAKADGRALTAALPGVRGRAAQDPPLKRLLEVGPVRAGRGPDDLLRRSLGTDW